MTPSYINAYRSGLFGPMPAPAPGASTAAPGATGIPQPSANYGVPQPSAANPNIAAMFGPLLRGSSMNPMLAGGPSNAAMAAANPAPPNPYAGLAQRMGWGGAPMDPGMSAGSSMSGISGTPGSSMNAAIAAAQNPMLAQAFRNQFGSLLGGGGINSAIASGGINPAIAANANLRGMASRYAPVLSGMYGGSAAPQGMSWVTGWDGQKHLLPAGSMS